MENKSGRTSVEAAGDTVHASAPPVEKLAYRTPGTVSVPAQPVATAIDWRSGDAQKGVYSVETSAALTAAAESELVARLEARLRATESASAARVERLEREGREAVECTRREGEQQAQAALDRMAGQVGAALESFRLDREQYFGRVEREVVELALAIAARILHREALLDPLLLAGAVRVALGQLGETTGIRLRCPAEDVERWKDLLAGAGPALEVAGDASMAAGECVLEARVGSVDLGVRAQLEEIERGFFDLLEQRPRSQGHRDSGLGTRE